MIALLTILVISIKYPSAWIALGAVSGLFMGVTYNPEAGGSGRS